MLRQHQNLEDDEQNADRRRRARAHNPGTFQALKELHEFRRRHLPFLKTVEDLELVREIGLCQVRSRPLMLKTLFLQGIGSVATFSGEESCISPSRRTSGPSTGGWGALMRKAWT